MKKFLFCIVCLPGVLACLPEQSVVESGKVSLHRHSDNTMVIEASDKAIIRHKSFDVQRGEKVRFIQPSSSSSVLNRIEGSKASKIFGSIESNGRVFLVNSQGIYFGKEAVVQVGSLIASTLQISNEDFLQGNFSFYLKERDSLAEICNEGFLAAAPDGAIVLMAPVIRNLGKIQATAGKVILASGEHVTIDFSGNGLLEFSVEGEIKDSIIEHLGSIQAESGEVSMRLPIVKKVIHEIVNHEGVERGEVFVVKDGEISLVSASSIVANNVNLEAENIQIAGIIDASSAKSLGGDLVVTGSQVDITHAEIDVSGLFGGGSVYVTSENVSVDSSSCIKASAKGYGNGGRVAFLSSKSTSFEGQVFARGGIEGGDGGFVETSSQGRMSIGNATVDTFAPQGVRGTWLLDPTILRITASGVDVPSGCSSLDSNIAAATIEAAEATVVLCANQIIQEVPIAMSNVGVGLVFTAPPSEVGTLLLQGGSITTKGGTITVTDLQTILSANTTLTTAVDGGPGADITFGSIDGPSVLTISAGSSGTITLGSLGSSLALAGVVIAEGKEAFLKDVTARNFIKVVPTVTLTQSATTFSLLSRRANAILEVNSIEGTTPEAESLTIKAGIGAIVSTGKLGTSVPLNAITIESNAEASLGDIQASSFVMNGGAGRAIFRDDVTTTGDLGFQVSARNIILGGIVDVSSLNLVAIGPILKSSIRQKIILGGGPSQMNSLKGSLGTSTYPLNVNTDQTLIIGANALAALSGQITASSIGYVPGNKPCTVIINGKTIVNCKARVSKLKPFPVVIFAASEDMTPQTLGIGYSPLPFNNNGIMTPFENVFELLQENFSIYQAMDL